MKMMFPRIVLPFCKRSGKAQKIMLKLEIFHKDAQKTKPFLKTE